MHRPLVVIDLAAGRATLGRAVAVVHVREGGALAYAGRVLRPLRFAERWRLAETASRGPSGSLAAGVLAASSAPDGSGPEEAGTGDEQVARMLAMHLAGARPDRAVPDFGTQVGALVAAGWSAREVLDADADVVDLLTVEDDHGEAPGSGWTSIVLDPGGDGHQPGVAALSPGELLRLLEQDLLGRLVPGRADQPAVDEPGASHLDRPAVREAGASPWAAPNSAAPPASVRQAGSATLEHAPDEGVATTAAVRRRDPTPAHASAPDLATHPRPIRADWAAPIGWTVPPAVPLGVPVSEGVSGWPGPGAPQVVAAGDVSTVAAPGLSSVRRATRPDASPAPVVLHDDVTASRVDRLALPPPSKPDPFDVADELATLLDEESDLRGLRR